MTTKIKETPLLNGIQIPTFWSGFSSFVAPVMSLNALNRLIKDREFIDQCSLYYDFHNVGKDLMSSMKKVTNDTK